jgi:hypothetical protein
MRGSPCVSGLFQNWPALGDGVQKRSVGHTDFMVFRLKDRMSGIYLRQYTTLARNLQPIADMQEFARVEAGRDIAYDVARSKSEGDSESQCRPTQNKARHDTHDFRIDFELRHRHHTDDEDDQPRNQLSQGRREINPRIARRLGDHLARELAELIKDLIGPMNCA